MTQPVERIFSTEPAGAKSRSVRDSQRSPSARGCQGLFPGAQLSHQRLDHVGKSDNGIAAVRPRGAGPKSEFKFIDLRLHPSTKAPQLGGCKGDSLIPGMNEHLLDTEESGAAVQERYAGVSRRCALFEGRHMYGHSHTGIGALVLTLVASAKGGIGYLVRAIASPHW